MRNIIVTLALLLLLLITAIQAVVPVYADTIDVEGRGIIKHVESVTLANPYTTKSIHVPLAFGDSDSFRSPLPASMSWDGRVALLSLLVLHYTAVLDDNGNEILRFVDAIAGGVYSEEGSLCDFGLGICIKYDIIDESKELVTYKLTPITEEYTFYVKASTESEAEIEVKMHLGFIATSLSIKNMIRVGDMYKVTVIATLDKYISYMEYKAIINETYVNYRTGYEEVLSIRYMEASSSKTYISPLPLP